MSALVVVLPLLAVTVAAADAPPPTAAEDSIAAAKRELQAMKAANAGADSGGVRAPQVAVPEFHAPVEPPPRSSTLTKEQLEEKKAEEKRKANWLVEAMMNPKGDAKQGTRQSDELTRTKETDLLLSANQRATETVAEAQRRALLSKDSETKAADTEPRPPTDSGAFNPLAKYMADWMTPGDYQLLGSKLDRPASPLPTPAEAASSTSVDNGAFAGLAGFGGDSPLPSRNSAGSTGNPFLAGISGPDSISSTLAQPPAFLPPPTPAPVPQYTPPPPPPQPAADRPALPDFVKPATDDKYFKPLKRF